MDIDKKGRRKCPVCNKYAFVFVTDGDNDCCSTCYDRIYKYQKVIMDLNKVIREDIVAHMINGKSWREAVYSAFDRAKQVYIFANDSDCLYILNIKI